MDYSGETHAKIHEMQTAVQMVKQSNDLILKRLVTNDFETRVCSCECHKKTNDRENSNLKYKVDRLREREQQNEKEVTKVQQQSDGLEKSLHELQSKVALLEARAANATAPSHDTSVNQKDEAGANTQKHRRTETVCNRDKATGEHVGGAAGTDSQHNTVEDANIKTESPQHSDRHTDSTRTEDVPKLNFTKSSSGTYVEQLEKKYISGIGIWESFARAELEEAKISGIADVGGIHTIICVDISASMRDNDAWAQASTFFESYVNGLEDLKKERGFEDQHVALVTFGHETKVVQRLTDDFSRIRHVFGSLKLGGPSPMYGGIIMSLAAGMSSKHLECEVNGYFLFTKIVIITDGYMTDTCLFRGPDVATEDKMETTTTDILKLIQGNNQRPFSCSFVKVGNANMEFLELVTTVGESALLDHDDGRKAAISVKYAIDQREWSENFLRLLEQESYLNEEGDEDAVGSYSDRMGRNENDIYVESNKSEFPAVGSRVRRGPDWRWRDEDGGGAGTVIGHHVQGGQIFVHWDKNQLINAYYYGGRDSRYDVLLADEPRVTCAGTIAVGCTVKPGIHWSPGASKVGLNETGVVIKVLKDNSQKVQVRWGNGVRGDYLYDAARERFEIELCAPSVNGTKVNEAIAGAARRSKNKNKNVSHEQTTT